MRIKEICDFVSRGTTPEYVDDSPFKVMNQATFSKGWLDESNIRFTSKPAYDAQITKGDLLMASTGGGVLGKVFYFDKDDTCFYADSHVSILRNSKGKHLMKFEKPLTAAIAAGSIEGGHGPCSRKYPLI